MLKKLFSFWSKDIGVDLGTANTLVYVKGKGIVINEPSIVAVNQKTGQILAIGHDARKMIGRTPGYIAVSRPLVAGVVSDFEVTEQMLRYFLEKVFQPSQILMRENEQKDICNEDFLSDILRTLRVELYEPLLSLELP